VKTQAKIIVAAALCLALVGGQTAVAGGGKAKTEVELTEVSVDPATGEGTYTGKVKSKKRCKGGRKVTVIHDSDPPFTIGETRTDEFGKWTIEGPVPPIGDRVIVKVSKSSKCKGASETYEFEGGDS